MEKEVKKQTENISDLAILKSACECLIDVLNILMSLEKDNNEEKK